MADAYSFGVIIWEIYTGKLPWAGMHPTQIIFVVTIEKRLLAIPAESPPAIQALLAACWERDPTLRPKMQKIEADFPEQDSEIELTSAAVFQHEPLAYTLSSQLSMSPASTEGVHTPQVRGCGVNGVAFVLGGGELARFGLGFAPRSVAGCASQRCVEGSKAVGSIFELQGRATL